MNNDHVVDVLCKGGPFTDSEMLIQTMSTLARGALVFGRALTFGGWRKFPVLRAGGAYIRAGAYNLPWAYAWGGVTQKPRTRHKNEVRFKSAFHQNLCSSLGLLTCILEKIYELRNAKSS